MNNKITPSNKAQVHTILFLFGSFCIGYNIAIAFHELGHAFAMILDGGGIQEYYLNPFSWSWNLGQNLNNLLFTAWGGVTFGLLFALLPAISLIWIKSNFLRIPILVLAGSAFLINGIYLLMGVFLNIGDGGELMHYGVSSAFILFLGLVYFIIALFLWILIQQLLGLHSQVTFTKRLIILCCGITPYLLMIFVYNFLFNHEQLLLWSSYAVLGTVTCLLFSISGHFWVKLYSRFHALTFQNSSYKPVALVNLIAVVIIFGELILFGIKDNPF